MHPYLLELFVHSEQHDALAATQVAWLAGAGLPERLVLTLSDDGKQSLVFGKFTLKEMEMDSALALLEHLTSD